MKPKRSFRRGALLFLIFCLLVAGATLFVRSRASASEIDASRLVGVERRDLSVEILEVGQIQPERRVELKSKVRGLVKSVNVNEGDRVKAGEILLRLDPVDYSREVAKAHADLSRAKNAFELADLRYQRARAGIAHGIVSAAELEAATHEREEKRLDVVSNRVTLGTAADRVRSTRVVSPIDGVVVQRGTEPGQAVTPGIESSFDGKPLLTVADLSRLLVKLDLNQIDVAKVGLGQSVELVVDALPEHPYHAKITRIAPASLRRPGKEVDVFPVEALLSDADTRIKPGMTAEARILIEKKENVVVLSLDTVKKISGKSFVTRARALKQGLAPEKVEVTLGARNDREAEVLGGVVPGDRVLVDPPPASANETKL